MPYYPNQLNPNNYQSPYNNQITTDPIFVAGKDGANKYPVAAGHTAALFDSTPDTNIFYLKTVDVNGFPQPLRIFDYQERIEIQNESGSSKEIEELRNDMTDLKKHFSELATAFSAISKPLQELLGPTEGGK